MQKRELLLYQAGQATQEIFDTYTETGEDFGMVMTRLDGYFSMKKNVDYVVFQFRQAVQKAGETVNQFATRLRKQAAHCEFSNLERELVRHHPELPLKTSAKVCPLRRSPHAE